MSKFRVRLFGGFEVWSEDRQVIGFESQKARALLAYLICNKNRSFSRDHLAGLLWPDSGAEAGRHALRQALYNLRSKLAANGDASPIRSSSSGIGFNAETECWIDVDAFEDSVQRGLEKQTVDIHHLSTAAQLYQGEFLSGFYLKENQEFEEWLSAEQTRLREAAIEALRKLVESYRRRGEFRFGVHYARRLVAIEPLSEEAHCELIHLLALSGQRSRALAQYEALSQLLREELGVEPQKATRALYASILAEATEKETESQGAEPIGPLIPLVGRAEGLKDLKRSWTEVLEGGARLTLVTGEAGIGKTRLIRSFLDAATSQRRAVVLTGRCYELSPRMAYLPFVEVLRCALTDDADIGWSVLETLPAEVAADLSRLMPEVREKRTDLKLVRAQEPREGQRRLFSAVAQFVEALNQRISGAGSPHPLILFLDDLHAADRDTFEMLEFLVDRIRTGPLWILVAYRPTALEGDHPLNGLARRALPDGAVSLVDLGRLDGASLEEIAESLVGEAQAGELAEFLAGQSNGVPLSAAELINFLWDEGVLVAREAGSWRLARPLSELRLPEEDFDALVRLRIRRLPNSFRRLATLAAVMGQVFDADILQAAADEHPAVVDVGLEQMVKRWLVRPFAHFWTNARRERDSVLWDRGVRRGSFEFSHKFVRRALYDEVDPRRRQAMHGHIATAHLQRSGEQVWEVLAYHCMEAGAWEAALEPLERSAERAQAVHAWDTALHYLDLALSAFDRLVAGAKSAQQARHWKRERARLEEARRRCAEAS